MSDELFDVEEIDELNVAEETGIDYHTPELGTHVDDEELGQFSIGGRATGGISGGFKLPSFTAEGRATGEVTPTRRERRKERRQAARRKKAAKKSALYRAKPTLRATPRARKMLRGTPQMREVMSTTMREALSRKGLAMNGCPAAQVDPVRRQLDAIRAQLILAKIQREATSEHNILSRQSGFRADVIRRLKRIAAGCP